MSTVQQYKDVQAEVEATKASIELLKSKLSLTESVENDVEIDEIETNLLSINMWAQDNIEKLESEQVVNDFLTSLKALMVEYSAVFDVVSTESGVGYGEQWGEGRETTPIGIKVSVNKDGVEASKVFDTISLSEDDI